MEVGVREWGRVGVAGLSYLYGIPIKVKKKTAFGNNEHITDRKW